ncbi:hypothetical protein D9757_003406 [Collybiopsis confluens]|uniref:Uncharacterized protein n=1 Tax=Collybiopsis confluens TaxID=2823264 RepID=A0A8H5HU26_9AGAR|nr:hypothetical protein D9757_003406 [Collybiopsis confluens]
MGRSAKVHKRVPRKLKSSAPASRSAQNDQAEQAETSKKKAILKEKTKQLSARSTRKEGEHVLAGADYVTLLMGGRKKAREEAVKLPREN